MSSDAGDGSAPASFDELLFLIQYQLCHEYRGLDPFVLQDRPYGQVIDLYADTVKAVAAARKDAARATQKPGAPAEIVRRPAGDDWF